MWGRTIATVLVIVLVLQTQGAFAAPPATLPGVGLAAPAPDGVPERWVVGVETIEGQTATIAERLRVLPGARLDITGSTLTFAAHPAGLTGIVAEPGSDVRITSSTLTGPEGAFALHLEGAALLDQSVVRGAARVVLQPRSLTDHVDDALGAQLERQVPGWRAVRALTAGTALLRGSLLEGPGPVVVAGVPVQYEGNLQPTTAVRLLDSTIRATGPGAAVECYATRQAPDPDFGLPVAVLAGEEFTRLELADALLEATTGPALRCPPMPQGYSIPARNVPLVDPALVQPVNAALPLPPSPEVEAGPALVTVQGGIWTGQGTGALVDGASRVEVRNTHFQGFRRAVDVQAASALVADATGTGLGSAFVADIGALTVQGGDFAGDATQPGLQVGGAPGAVSVTGATFRGFDVGVATGGPATLDDITVDRADHQCVKVEGAGLVLTGSTLRGCSFGVHLIETTGATIEGNGILDVWDPLLVSSGGPTLAHFQHTVTGNTVHGRALSYLVQASGMTVAEPVGHLVAAFSRDVRYTDLDLSHGTWHVVASTGIVLGATTANTPGLLAATVPGAADDYLQVWQDVQYKPYSGSMLGPAGARETGYANDLDAAWTLADHWRAEGRTVRFVDGTMEGPTDAFLNWVGMRDPRFAFAMDGVEALWFGPTYRMDRTWLELQAAPGVFVEADPSYQQFDWTEPLDLVDTAGIDTTALALAAAQGATLDYGLHGAVNLNTAAIDALMSEYHQEGMGAINASGEALRGGDIAYIAKPRAILPAEDVLRTPLSRFDEVPHARKWTARLFSVHSGAPTGGFDTEAPLDELYGKRLTIASAPDNEGELAKVQAAGSLYNLDPRTVWYTTFLYADGVILDAIGGVRTVQPDGSVRFSLPASTAQRTVALHPGDLVDFRVQIKRPGGAVNAEHTSAFRVGGTYSVVLDIGGTPAALVNRTLEDYRDILQRWGHGDATTLVSQDELLGALYHLQGQWYFNKLHQFSTQLGAQFDVVEVPIASVAMTGSSLVQVNTAQGLRVAPTPPYFDILNLNRAYPMEGNLDRLFDYNLATGIQGSALEDKVFTEMYSLPAVSTVKVLTEANRLGVPLYHLNSTETTALPHLQLPEPVMDSIVDAINRGWDVVVPKTQTTYLNWSGVGWLEYDTSTGSTGWLIYGGTAPIQGSAVDAPLVMHGGAGAQYGPSGNRLIPDFGYEGWAQTGVEWGTTGIGTFGDITGTALAYKNLNNAANTGRRVWDGVALNNDHRALLGKFDVPGRYGQFFDKAGNVMVVVSHANDMYNILTNDQPADTKVVQMVGVTAINVATVASTGAVIGTTAKAGAIIGGLVGDGPGAVIGAVAGGIAGALLLGWGSDQAKKGFLGLF